MPPSDGGAPPPPPPRPSADQLAVYQERILEHYRRPRNRGPLAGADRTVELANPLCGDTLRLHVALAGDTVRAASFEGDACSITVASASMMTERVRGLALDEVRALGERFAAMVAGDAAAAADERLGELRALAGVARLPARHRCALMPWEALGRAVGEAGR